MSRLSTEFRENRLSSFFCIILRTNKLTNAVENVTSLAEVIVEFQWHRAVGKR